MGLFVEACDRAENLRVECTKTEAMFPGYGAVGISTRLQCRQNCTVQESRPVKGVFRDEFQFLVVDCPASSAVQGC